ncbi:hypothetical protein HDE_12482 [Halotydeus destructor]|nr:hypothetical protein HDE_12482 [Halotydeus destructor]
MNGYHQQVAAIDFESMYPRLVLSNIAQEQPAWLTKYLIYLSSLQTASNKPHCKKLANAAIGLLGATWSSLYDPVRYQSILTAGRQVMQQVVENLSQVSKPILVATDGGLFSGSHQLISQEVTKLNREHCGLNLRLTNRSFDAIVCAQNRYIILNSMDLKGFEKCTSTFFEDFLLRFDPSSEATFIPSILESRAATRRSKCHHGPICVDHLTSVYKACFGPDLNRVRLELSDLTACFEIKEKTCVLLRKIYGNRNALASPTQSAA